MTTSTQVDLVEFRTNTVGTGSPLSIGAATDGHRGSEALTDGATYSYSIASRGGYEVGRGVYSQSGQTITRGTLLSSDSNNPIAIQSGSVVAIVLLAEDLSSIVGGSPDFTIGNVTSGFPASVGIRGVSPNFILDFVLETGEPGATGPAPNLALGTTTIVPPDTLPSVGLSGTSPNYTLSFALPAVSPGGMFSRSDTPRATPLFINGIVSQYTRIVNYCVNDGLPGSGPYGTGILQVKWSNDNKAIEDTICKSRATTIGGTPTSIQAGDVIYTQYWYGDAGITVGAPAGSMAHIGWYRVAIDGAPTGDSTELPGWYGLATGTGFHSPGSRYAFEINSKQQVHFPGRTSNPFGPTVTNAPAASYGANFILGVGDSAAGGAPFKWTLAAAALLATPEAGALEVDAAGALYTTDNTPTRRKVVAMGAPVALAAALPTDGSASNAAIATAINTIRTALITAGIGS